MKSSMKNDSLEHYCNIGFIGGAAFAPVHVQPSVWRRLLVCIRNLSCVERYTFPVGGVQGGICNFSRVLPDLAGTLRLRGDIGTGARYFWRSVVSDRCVSDSGGSVWRESDFCMAGAAQKAWNGQAGSSSLWFYDVGSDAAVDSIGSAGNLLVQWCGQLHVFLLRIIAACFGGIVVGRKGKETHPADDSHGTAWTASGGR